MRVLSWNCRGLGSPAAVRTLCELVSSCNPQVVCLLETKSAVSRFDSIRRRCGFLNCFAVPAAGKSGGLALLWKEGFELEVKSFSFYHVDCVVDVGKLARFTLFYGSSHRIFKEQCWNILLSLSYNCDLPWCIMGDFNEILLRRETTGDYDGRFQQVLKFREVIDKCGLHDLPYEGNPFTYSNKRRNESEVKCRLDRAFGNSEWETTFPNYIVRHLVANRSDHCPILLTNSCVPLGGRKRHFFEAMWTRDESYRRVLAAYWNSSVSQGSIFDKFQGLQRMLANWNRSHFGNVQWRLSSLKRELVDIRSQPRSDANIDREMQIEAEIDEWLYREEILWKQRSKIHWLAEGDDNTRFFHNKASARKRRHHIQHLLDCQGNQIRDEEGIKYLVTEYFRKLFSSEVDIDFLSTHPSFSVVTPKLSESDNHVLLSPYSCEEVRIALFQLYPFKAPGLDGLPPVFFQKSWDVVSDEFVTTCLNFLNGDYLDVRLNETVITLVPKVTNPRRVQDYRPISLCNVIMRVISKVMANRLKGLLDGIISPTQTAFVPGRHIGDNILLGHEIAHFLRHNRTKSKYASLKLDMAKAFDRIEWCFLEKMLILLGFDMRWITKIKTIITTVTYRVNLNGSLSEIIKPSRGLRQGDPLSPYLFILCSEWLSLTLAEEANRTSTLGVQICRRAPTVTHLFFADDSLLYFRSTIDASRRQKDILITYQLISGQLINFEKSELVCCRCTDSTMKKSVASILGVRLTNSHEKYLGLPQVIGQNKSSCFKHIVDKVEAKIKGWSVRNMSFGGREVLIKSVISAIPQFAMMCYLIPVKILSRIQSIIGSYWWGGDGSNTAKHWINKEKMQENKENGGMQFRDLKSYNIAFLAKQGWRILQQPSSLLSKILKARYFPTAEFLHSSVRHRCSHAWRGLMKGLDLLKKGCAWDENMQEYIWKESHDGLFSVKSAYNLAKTLDDEHHCSKSAGPSSSQVRLFWKHLWKSNLPRKLKILGWRIYHNAVPVKANLRKFLQGTDMNCSICGFAEESSTHVFLDCWWSRAVWKALGYDSLVQDIDVRQGCMADWLYWCFQSLHHEDFKCILIALYFIWYNRNCIEHKRDNITPMQAFYKIKSYYKLSQTISTVYNIPMNAGVFEWKPPPNGTIKINVDGSYSKQSGKASIGIIGRDHFSNVLFVRAKTIDSVSCALRAEGIALEEALSLAHAFDYRRVIFETDCMSVVDFLIRGKTNPMHMDWYTKSNALLLRHQNWDIALVAREANGAADALAKLCNYDGRCWTRLDCIPVYVGNYLHQKPS